VIAQNRVMHRKYGIPVLQEQKTGYVKQRKRQSQARGNDFSGYALKVSSHPYGTLEKILQCKLI